MQTTVVSYALINTESASEDEILRKIRKIPNVKEAYRVHGIYDIIARVEAESLDELNEIVKVGIRDVDKVTAVLTLLCHENSVPLLCQEAKEDV